MSEFFRVRLTDDQREAQLHRIIFVETNIMLPIKVVAILATAYFYRTILGTISTPIEASDAPHAYFTQLKFYAAGNLVFGLLLLAARVGELWPRSIRLAAFWLAMLDNLFLSGLIYFTEGLNSVFYWLYIGLMVRSAVDFPVFWQQAILNISTGVFYTLAVILNEETFQFFGEELYWLRLANLLLVGTCCWGVYVLIERGRRRAQAQQEFQLRSKKMEAAGRLAAEVAHQLKNPLGIINNAAYLLRREADKKAPAPAGTVAVIQEEVVRADRILTQLMNYSQLSEGRLENLDINVVFEQALAQAQRGNLETKVKVVRHLAGELPALAAHRAQLEECFLNLFRNAIEAMPQGGTLTVSSRYAGEGHIEMEVADTGPGIPPEILARVFEAFVTAKAGGTGLGLAIVKNIVETYDGTIAVDSKPGEGTTFRVVLPVQTRPSR